MQPPKPYYAVIFSSTRNDEDAGYAAMAGQMEELARKQPGFLGLESARDGLGITVSYWESLADISRWKANAEHRIAQGHGKGRWYSWYKVRICLVEREYDFQAEGGQFAEEAAKG